MRNLVITIHSALPEAAIRRKFVVAGLSASALLALLALTAVLLDSPHFPSLRDYQNANPPMLAIWAVVALFLLNPPALFVALILAPLTDSTLLQLLAGVPAAIWWWRRLAGILRVVPLQGAI